MNTRIIVRVIVAAILLTGITSIIVINASETAIIISYVLVLIASVGFVASVIVVFLTPEAHLHITEGIVPESTFAIHNKALWILVASIAMFIFASWINPRETSIFTQILEDKLVIAITLLVLVVVGGLLFFLFLLTRDAVINNLCRLENLLANSIKPKKQKLLEAASNGDVQELSRILKKNSKMIHESGGMALVNAISKGHPVAAKYLLDLAADPNAKDDSGKTVLMFSSENGYLDVVEELIKKNVDVNSKDKNKNGGLFFAVNNGYLDVVTLLLSNGAAVNDGYQHGWTALMCSAINCNIEITKALVDQGANINQVSLDGDTAMMMAANAGCTSIVNHLIYKGAYLDIKDNKGNTALMDAASKGYVNLVKLLIENGADINIENDSHTTALLLALKYPVENKIINALVNATTRLTFKSKEAAERILILATKNGFENIVSATLEEDIDVDAIYDANSSDTALMIDVSNGYFEIAEALIKRGASLSIKRNNGWTVLEHAIHHHSPDIKRSRINIIHLLINHGAEINIIDSSGKTLVERTRNWRHHEISDILLKAGAKGT